MLDSCQSLVAASEVRGKLGLKGKGEFYNMNHIELA